MIADRDPRSGYWPFHQEAVAYIRGIPSQARRGEARVYELAKQLKAAVEDDTDATVHVISHRKGGSCVQIEPFTLPEPVETAFDEEDRSLGFEGTRINLRNGTQYRPEDRSAKRKKRRRRAERTADRHDVPERAQALQQALHDLPAQRFTKKFKAAQDDLRTLAQRWDRPDAEVSVNPYTAILRELETVVLPLYKFTGKTLRLTPAGPSLAALPEAMRQRVFDDYLEVDMASAQLALAASLWPDLGDLRTFLGDSDTGWWMELIDWLCRKFELPRTPSDDRFDLVKGMLKGFTYGLFYGMRVDNLRRLGTPHDPSTDKDDYYESIRTMNRLFLDGSWPKPRDGAARIGEVLFRHPLVEQLLDRREEMLAQIEAHGGITDCFGRSIETSENRDAKSVLAEHMQNAELKVMLPVGEMIVRDDELRFGLWQHDGVTFAPRRRKPWAYRQAVQKARDALQRGCKQLEEELGIPPIETRLTVDYGADYLSP
jgi:hypothetical protein